MCLPSPVVDLLLVELGKVIIVRALTMRKKHGKNCTGFNRNNTGSNKISIENSDQTGMTPKVFSMLQQ